MENPPPEVFVEVVPGTPVKGFGLTVNIAGVIDAPELMGTTGVPLVTAGPLAFAERFVVVQEVPVGSPEPQVVPFVLY